ncbi:MAG: SEL1-like repeat protein [Elusimicrobia bacterium]|nr:SEL1-like repeat protein [Elusimicrobiota bacterium]
MNPLWLVLLSAALCRAENLAADAADAKAALETLRKARPGDTVTVQSAQGFLGFTYGYGPEGLAVVSVAAGSPAEQAGLRAGERLVSVGGRATAALPLDEVKALLGDRAGQKIPLQVLREGRPVALELERGSLAFLISGDLDKARAVLDWRAFPCQDAARWLKSPAKGEEAEAAYLLARVYAEGCGESVDLRKAFTLAKKAAQADHAPALALAAQLGQRLADGDWYYWAKRGCDAAQAAACLAAGKVDAPSLERAAALGSGQAAYDMAKSYALSSAAPEVRRRWLARAAVLGHADAWREFTADFIARPRQDREPDEDLAILRAGPETGAVAEHLGWMLAAGRGVVKDHAEALRRLLPGARQGRLAAMTGAGWLLANGEGVERDPAQAVEWFAKAAKTYDACAARNNLGLMYLYGEGADKNEPEGVKLVKEAGNAGYGCVLAGGTNLAAGYNIALIYEHGVYEAKDLDMAKACYKSLAEKGHPWALNRMGEFSLADAGGSAGSQDERKAAEYFRAAAKAGDPVAQFRLGESYEKGRGVIKDSRQAAIWYKRAAAFSGDPRGERVGPDFAMLLDVRKAMPDSAEGAGELAALKNSAARKAEEMRSAPGASAAAQSSAVDRPGYKLSERPHDFAVVVGVERYAHLPRADYAERDAQAVRDHLVALGYPERNVVLLKGAEASRASLAKNLETWLPMNVREDSAVFFYFSGHGSPDPTTGRSFLVPADGDAQFLDDTAYPVARLYEKLGALKARRVLAVLDSCFSGVGERSALAKGTRPLVLAAQTAGLPEKVTVLTASLASEVSGTDDEQGHGLFTYWLLKGLNGEAAGADGAVTLKSLHQFLQPRVQDEARRANRLQTPQLQGAADVRLR